MITLSNVMKTNSLSCMGFGAVFFFFPEQVSVFLSTDNQAPKIVFTILGLGLFLNGLHLFWASLIPMPSKRLVLYFSISDFIWVISSISLLVLGLWITTAVGIVATLLVAVIVGILGLMQMIKRKAMGSC